METPNQREKFLGGMIGSALGDAIGELAFRHSTRQTLQAAVEREDELIYTDDTAMAIGLAESIAEAEELDPQRLGDTFRSNYRREPWRGYASGPPRVFSMVERENIPYSEAARRLYGGEGSFGNGAAMRIVALGLFFHAHDADDLYEQARRSAMVTHAHPIGIDGAAIQARAVAQVVSLAPQTPLPTERFTQHLMEIARTPEMEQKLRLVQQLIAEDVLPSEAAERLGRGVAVHQSLPFAIYAFLRHPDVFEDCLFCAALNGGDRDTLGAMACAISGAYLGVRALPLPWRKKIENHNQIASLATRLAEMA